MVLQASGHSTVYANGEPRAGDPYANGWPVLPVRLHAGELRDPAPMRRASELPALPEEWREHFRQQLARHGDPPW